MIKFNLVAENEEGEVLFESSANATFFDANGVIEVTEGGVEILFSRAYSLIEQVRKTKQKELDSLKEEDNNDF